MTGFMKTIPNCTVVNYFKKYQFEIFKTQVFKSYSSLLMFDSSHVRFAPKVDLLDQYSNYS